MKKAICHYSFHRRVGGEEKLSLLEVAKEVAALGVPAVDYHMNLLGDPETAPDRILKAVKEAGVELSGLSMGNNFNMEDPEKLKEQIEAVKRWLQVASDVGVSLSRIFGGGIKDRSDADALKAGRQRVLGALGEVTREAEKLGIVLALENHGGLPCTGEEQVEIIEAIGSDSLRATIDVGNYMGCGQEAVDGTKLAAKYCAYVHFKDFDKVPDDSKPWGWSVKSTTVGKGVVDHRACLESLKEAGFDGYVALEYEGPDDEKIGVPESVKFMDEVMKGF